VGKTLIIIGLLIILIGILLLYKVPLPFGNLPGDIVIKGKNSTIYFPIATSILVSIILSLLFYLFSRS